MLFPFTAHNGLPLAASIGLDVIIINLGLGGLDVAIKQRQRNQIRRELAISKFANWILCFCHIRGLTRGKFN